MGKHNMDGLSDALVGRKIVSVNESTDTLVLDNGAVVKFEGYGDCCAYATVRRMSRLDHVITSIQAIETDSTDSNDFPGKSLSVYALSEGSVDTEIAHIVGDEGTGYYTYGVRVTLNGVEIDGVDW